MATLTVEELKEILPNPKIIVEELDKYIIGQTTAKQTLALMLLNRAILKLKRAGKLVLDTPIQKSNVMLIGPTGTGKTALIKALALISDIPISITDVTGITAAGYIGGKVEDILAQYVTTIDDSVKNTATELEQGGVKVTFSTKRDIYKESLETGIIYIDEIDKLRKKENHGFDYGDAVQNELLKILEGENVNIQSSRLRTNSLVTHVNTTNILFIVGGAFSGIEDIIGRRLSKSAGIGFSADMKHNLTEGKREQLLSLVTNNDLVEYGFKPEFLGRIPLRATLSPLDLESMAKIITEPKNSILEQYTSLFKLFKIKLILEQGAINELASIALKLKMGARSLKLLFNQLLIEDTYRIFSIPKGKLVITEEDVKKRCTNY